MIEKLLNLMPILPAGTNIPLWVIYLALAVGGIFWTVGAKISRSLFTLGFVAVACLIGRRLPVYFHWQVDGMATAVGAAVVMGVLGYSLHRVWVAISLGLTLAIVGALGVWLTHSSADPFPWPPLPSPFDPLGYAQSLWQSLPGDVAHLLPLICGTLAIAGFTLTLLWPRLARTLLYSLVGVVLLVAGGLVLAQTRYPQWLNHLPHKRWQETAILAAIVLIGMRVQWVMTWRRKTTPVIEPVPAPAAQD